MSHHFKILAFTVCFLLAGIAGNNLKAQTAGPTAPEYSSFEPVDVTDMVSLVSGDFTYVLPLLEVPGPEGGYPVALSYHAGIKPHEQASWVGLGWTLNTGAIFRTIDGFPDDFNGKSRYVWDYWDGGETRVTSVGVGYCGYHVGLDFATDTYQGFGVGGSVGVGANAKGFGVKASIGVSPYGDAYASLGLSVSTTVGSVGNSSFSAGAGIGVSTNFESVSGYANGGVSYTKSANADGRGLSFNSSILGASISSSSLKPGMSVAGSSISQSNSNAGKISSFSRAWAVSIPIPYTNGLSIDVGHSYTRYWSSEWDYLYAYGSLFPASINSASWGNGNNSSFDSYTIPDMANVNYAKKPDTEASSWGSFPAYDNYTVAGQGIGGSIQPYILETAALKTQDRVSDGHQSIEYLSTNGTFSKQVYFRFKNDFSNSFLKGTSTVDLATIGETEADIANGVSASNAPDEYSGVYGFNSTTNQLAGSRNVTWFTNGQIYSQVAYNHGFISSDKPGENSNRLSFGYDDYVAVALDGQDEIPNDPDVGGNDDISDQIGGFMITNESGVTYHYSIPVYTYQELTYTWYDAQTKRVTKNYHPYAYTWLLTAITGPDYVDDWNGTEGMYGPSANDYGYWVKFDYGMWSPNYQWRSPSDKPFEKDIDGDIKTFSRGKKQIYYLNAIRTRSHTALFVKKHRADGKGVASMSISYEDEGNPKDEDGIFSYEFSAGRYPTALLALDEIILFKNNALDNRIAYWDVIKTMGSAYNFEVNNKGFHLGENVIDVGDIGDGIHTIPISDSEEEVTIDIYKQALRVIKFNTSQTLCNGVDNSFDENGTLYGGEANNTKSGKLTLDAITFFGTGTEESLPPINFSYNTTPHPDIEYDPEDPVTHNNPNWQADAEDIWGYYKSDYNSEIENDNVRKMVTTTSKNRVNAWSLSDIETSLGAKVHIDYESDSYLPPKLYGLRQVNVRKIEYNDYTSIVKLHTDYFPIDLSDKFVIGATYSCTFNTKVSSPITIHCRIDNVSKIQGGTSEWEIIAQALTTNIVLRARLKNWVENGELSFEYPVNSIIHGGGIRVSSLSLITDRYTKNTHYNYQSGHTSYEPYSIDVQPFFSQTAPGSWLDDIKNEFKMEAYTNFYNLLKVARFVPPPGVMYKQVTLTESIKHHNTDGSYEYADIPGKKVYNFEVFDIDKHLEIDLHTDNLAEEDGFKRKVKTYSVKDYTSQVGNLVKVEEFGTDDILLKRVRNYYAHDVNEPDEERPVDEIIKTDYSGQGVIQQEFQQYKKVNKGGDYVTKEYTCHVNRYEEYPSIQVKKVEWNDKTQTESYTQNLAFDFYSGQPTKVLTTNPYGIRLLSESKPAYLYYPEMGPIMKLDGETTGKNMLTQTAYTASYVLDNATDPFEESAKDGVLKADVTVWNSHVATNNGNTQTIWQKAKDYVFVGDEATPLTVDGAFGYNAFAANNYAKYLLNPFDYEPYTGGAELPVPLPGNFWQKTVELTRYNHFSKVEEMQDINGNYSCVKYNHKKTDLIAAVANAEYKEAAFSSFEYQDADPGLLFGLGDLKHADNKLSHTGLYSYIINSKEKNIHQNDVEIFRLPAGSVGTDKMYTASVWVYIANGYNVEAQDLIRVYASIGGNKEYMALPRENKKAGAWYLVDLTLEAPAATEIVIGIENNADEENEVLIDDFRFAPLTATITSYVYDYYTGQLTHILDANNLFTEFEYDGFGKLKRVSKEIIGYAHKVRVSEQYMHYGRSSESE